MGLINIFNNIYENNVIDAKKLKIIRRTAYTKWFIISLLKH